MNGLDSYKKILTPGSHADQPEQGLWRLSIPSGQPSQYRCSQLEDYADLPRGRFRWRAPVRLECQARVSHSDHPGTWGFGFWNDPFSANMKIRGSGPRLPALPNAAWFFYASTESQLSLTVERQACGFLASVFRSPLIPSWFFLPGYIFFPLIFIHTVSRWAINILATIIRDEFAIIDNHPTEWNTYRLEYMRNRVEYYVNDRLSFRSNHAPRGPLGALVWIDNQYAGFTPDGKIQAGLLENGEPAWLEIKDWKITELD